MSTDTGGPAFPAGAIRKTRQRPNDPGSDFVVSDMTEPRNAGMTLRDYFAAKAMQSLLATWDQSSEFPCNIDASPASDGDSDSPSSYMARAAYIYANAMLEARK